MFNSFRAFDISVGFSIHAGCKEQGSLSHSYLQSKEVKEASSHVQFLHMYAYAHTPATTIKCISNA